MGLTEYLTVPDLLCLLYSTSDGGPLARRQRSQRDLCLEPEPEPEQPDGGFRKVQGPTPHPPCQPHLTVGLLHGSTCGRPMSCPFPGRPLPCLPSYHQLYAELRKENERLREALTETTLKLAQLKVELERATQVGMLRPAAPGAGHASDLQEARPSGKGHD